MTCLRPVVLYRNKKNEQVVPCGRCVVCEDKKRKEWYVRVLSEVGYCDYSKFVTLTYDDLSLPDKNSLCHEHFQSFVKRLRKELFKNGLTLKYYMCGEYGEQKGRPHYHMIALIYGELPDKEYDIRKVIEEKWTLGYASFGTVTPRSVMYCLNYMKKQYKLGETEDRTKPYQRMSQGLGLQFLLDNEETLASRGVVKIKNYSYGIPRYFRKKSEKVKEAFEENKASEDYASNALNLKKQFYKTEFEKDLREVEQYELNKITARRLKRH